MIHLTNGELLFEKIGVNIPKILLPAGNKKMWEAWAAVACDQYTSQPDYWKSVSEITADVPSSYHLMLPEIYLEEEDADARIEAINRTMVQYLASGILREEGPELILVERDTKRSPVRHGLMMALDLEAYDYSAGSGSLIRATEGTVVERIPPRMKIRKDAVLEMPHVMILIDDPEKTVVEPLLNRDFPVLYDFDLMKNGGHIRGSRISDPAAIQSVTKALTALADPDAFAEKYSLPSDTPVLLFAVGDGNHSLASAKCHWEAVKNAAQLTEEESRNHPARYALAEIVNIHDAGILFEPIHRVLFHADKTAFLDGLAAYFGDRVSCTETEGVPDVSEPMPEYEGCHTVRYVTDTGCGYIFFDKKIHMLAVGALQEYLDFYTAKHAESQVDYIHGTEVVRDLGTAGGNIGFFLPAMEKGDFFKTVICKGSLPRKTFSMGEAFEKRYYIECRKIK